MRLHMLVQTAQTRKVFTTGVAFEWTFTGVLSKMNHKVGFKAICVFAQITFICPVASNLTSRL